MHSSHRTAMEIARNARLHHFSREALRFDPRNPELIERAFVASVSNGNMTDAFPLAERLLAREPNNGMARLVLGVRAIKMKQFAAARAQFSSGTNGQQRDLTSTLLSAWAYQGSGETKSTDPVDPRFRKLPLGTSIATSISGAYVEWSGPAAESSFATVCGAIAGFIVKE